MKKTDVVLIDGRPGAKQGSGHLAGLVVWLVLWLATAANAQVQWPQVALSRDGVPIAYEVSGNGEPALVFVHGWSCDSRYWRAQVPYFARKHRVVTLDLAGHGHSGTNRSSYTMGDFGEDVAAVVRATENRKVVLIGHSMGGIVIAEAARCIPESVAGLIGVDTLQNIEYPMTSEELEKMVAPLEQDFPTGCRQFVGRMLLPETDPNLREWIMADMAAAPPTVALSAMRAMLSMYLAGAAAKAFDAIRVPVMTVNADLWPVNAEANRRHMASFEAVILKKADHFLMMNRPAEFNHALEKAIGKIAGKKVP